MMTLSPYSVVHTRSFYNGDKAALCWIVEGPGVDFHDGAVPRGTEDMTQLDAEHLARLLNCAYRHGRRTLQGELLGLLGLSTWGGSVSANR